MAFFGANQPLYHPRICASGGRLLHRGSAQPTIVSIAFAKENRYRPTTEIWRLLVHEWLIQMYTIFREKNIGHRVQRAFFNEYQFLGEIQKRCPPKTMTVLIPGIVLALKKYIVFWDRVLGAPFTPFRSTENKFYQNFTADGHDACFFLFRYVIFLLPFCEFSVLPSG